MLVFISSIFAIASLFLSIDKSHARCFDPAPAFPIPKFRIYNESAVLKKASQQISNSLESLVSQTEFNISSFSIEVTTSEESLWALHHTAREKDPKRPGAKVVNGNSVYRMASVTKAFTTLAIIQQHIAGNLSLDDPINQYIPELVGSIPWKDITLRTVASQLSGIPREFAQSDFINAISDPIAFGLPPVTRVGLPECDEYYGFDRPCNVTDLLSDLVTKEPLWPPKQKSTYSNLNFVLLGIVIENVTGLTYTEYVEKSILQPLGMESSSFVKSSDSTAVLPVGDNYWDVDEGVQRPTGGLYSSSSDMSKFVRYVLTHYNGLTSELNWLHPASYSTTGSSFFGMPWEIFRTESILPSTSRPTTFVTKSGGVPGYFSIIVMVPQYDLGISILTASPSESLKEQILETVTRPLISATEEIAQSDLSARYTGVFSARDRNSTLTLAQTATKSLYVESFISNSTDVLITWLPFLSALSGSGPFRIQLVPTLLYRDEKNHAGELWRGVVVPEKRNLGKIWDDFCITNDDPAYYAGTSIFEVVFWGGEDGRKAIQEVELSSFRVKLGRVRHHEGWAEENVVRESSSHHKGPDVQQQIVLGEQ